MKQVRPSLASVVVISQLAIAVACAGGGSGDYVVVSVSGHCSTDCDYLDVNQEYLDAEGAAEAVADALPGHARVQAYGDSYYTMEDTRTGAIIVVGFIDLVSDLRALRDGDEEVVVLCHSHGCVWAHTALQVVDELEVAALVDLDAESIGWEDDTFTGGVGDEWADVIAEDGTAWPYDIGWAANAWDVPGLSELQDVEDVVPDSVGVNLEVASADMTFIQDAEPNHYGDGSTADILFFQSEEAHEGVDDFGSDSMRWVTATLPGVL